MNTVKWVVLFLCIILSSDQAVGRQSDVSIALNEVKIIQATVTTKLTAIQSELDRGLASDSLPDESQEKLRTKAAKDSADAMMLATEEALKTISPFAEDASTVDSLIWIVVGARGSNASDQAATLLEHCHPIDKRTIELAYRHKSAVLTWVEPMLRAQIANPEISEADHARLLFALGKQLQSIHGLPSTIAELSHEELDLWIGTHGKERVDSFRRIDTAMAEEQAIRVYSELRERFGTLRLMNKVEYRNLADAAIFAIQNLSIGKTVPDIEGEDLDGVKFKLSDYRGKVVMLSFWGAWCGPCMAMVPREIELVERLKGKRFALVGVNSDADKDELRQKLSDLKIEVPWRSFWCGESGPLGEIPTKWSISGWPTVYLIDHRGVIRTLNTTNKNLDAIIDSLIAEIPEE